MPTSTIRISPRIQSHKEYFNTKYQDTVQARTESSFFTFAPLAGTLAEVGLDDTSASIVLYSSHVDIEWASYIAEKLYAIPGVESVYIGIERDHIDVWTVIPHRDVPTMEQVYQAEEDIYDTFSPAEQVSLFFDFHIIYRNGSDEKDLLPRQAIQMSR